MPRNQFAMVGTHTQLRLVLEACARAGIDTAGISAIFPSRQPQPGASGNAAANKTAAVAPSPEVVSDGRAVAGVGLLGGLGVLAVPGLGAVVAAGPLLAAVGAMAGDLVRCLVAHGVPEGQARRYESLLRVGGILISIRADDPGRLDRARAILQGEGATDVTVPAVIGAAARQTPRRSTRPHSDSATDLRPLQSHHGRH
jgi:hypothetical protein